MKTRKESLRRIVSYLNNPDDDGGFWLPNIQRPFVWSEEQICRLFDSILREYPISTLLTWRTKSGIRRRKFIDNFREHHRHHLTDFYVPPDTTKKCLVLDGQQRLQSLLIGLKGSYDSRELYFDLLSGDIAAPDDVKFRFEFKDASSARFPWIKFKSLVFSQEDPVTAALSAIAGAGRELTDLERHKVSRHVGLVFKTFHSDDGIGFQELDSIENESLYTEDDVVEVFIRANSGGTKLGKSDLLFSLLAAEWETADQGMEELLDQLNSHGFAFPRDFVLKTCLTLLGQGARYEVSKFRKPGVREQIESKWDRVSEALRDVLDFVRSKTLIRCDKALPTNLVLIPLVYLRYHFPQAWKDAQAQGADTYVIRASLAGAFGGVPDQLIDEIVKTLDNLKRFDLAEVFGVIRRKNRPLEIAEERFWAMGYGSDTIHLLFNLWYPAFNYTPLFESSLPQVDHVFPQSELRKVKAVNPNTGRKDVLRYHDAERNQLANCMLLTAEENGFGRKCNKLPQEWFQLRESEFIHVHGPERGAQEFAEYLKLHLIPDDRTLWVIDKFEEFIEARKKLIDAKFRRLGVLAPRLGAPAVQ